MDPPPPPPPPWGAAGPAFSYASQPPAYPPYPGGYYPWNASFYSWAPYTPAPPPPPPAPVVYPTAAPAPAAEPQMPQTQTTSIHPPTQPRKARKSRNKRRRAGDQVGRTGVQRNARPDARSSANRETVQQLSTQVAALSREIAEMRAAQAAAALPVVKQEDAGPEALVPQSEAPDVDMPYVNAEVVEEEAPLIKMEKSD